MSAIGKLVVAVLLFALPLRAEDASDDAPAIYQSTPNFYNAMSIGNLSVTWHTSATDIAVDYEFTLTLSIAGASNPHRVRRPDLANMPAFKAVFRQVTNGNDPPATRDAKSVTFTYRLRARTTGRVVVPELPFDYFHVPSGELRTKFLDAIPLTVRAIAATPETVRPLEAPERFFELFTDEERLREPITTPTLLNWLLPILALVVLALIWIIDWRHRNPDGVRLAKLRQNRAVRSALDGLDAAKQSPDPLAATQRIFETYLMDRLGFFSAAPVPSELERGMREADWPSERIDAAMQLLRQCDAARFGTTQQEVSTLIDRARELILSGETGA